MKKMKKDNQEVPKKKTTLQELSRRDAIIKIFIAREAISKGVIIALSFFCFFLAIQNINDDELQVYSCPANFYQDAPIMLTKIEHEDVDAIEKYLRGFIRQYVRAIYPKNSTEAETMYRFAGNHSKGVLRQTYLGMASKAKDIGSELDGGRFTDFFTVTPITEKNTIIISKKTDNSWSIQIEGYLNDKKGITNDDRGAVTLKFVVEKGEAKLGGSYSGLYVTSFEIIAVKDYVSGNEEVL